MPRIKPTEAYEATGGEDYEEDEEDKEDMDEDDDEVPRMPEETKLRKKANPVEPEGLQLAYNPETFAIVDPKSNKIIVQANTREDLTLQVLTKILEKL